METSALLDKNGNSFAIGQRVKNERNMVFTVYEDQEMGLSLVGKNKNLREKLTPALAKQLVII